MSAMENLDHTVLDGKLLRIFVTVYESGSVTRAADVLQVNQSAVSYGLKRLRDILGDDLFVPKGRGITPTKRADRAIVEARQLLASLQAFCEAEEYDPSADRASFSIAANDFEAEVIIKPLLEVFRARAPNSCIRVVQAKSQNEWPELLRSNSVDLVLAPELQTGDADLMQQKLFTEKDICFYDPKHQTAPDTLDKFCSSPHAVMLPGKRQKTEVDQALEKLGYSREIVVTFPNFAPIASVIDGTNIIATMPERLENTLFRTFQSCEPPVTIAPSVITQIWHVKNTSSKRHIWLRRMIKSLFD